MIYAFQRNLHAKHLILSDIYSADPQNIMCDESFNTYYIIILSKKTEAISQFTIM